MSAVTDWLSTLASIGTLGVAAYATANWHKAPARQRRDDCTSAIHMCASFIGRTVSFATAKQIGPDRVWRAHDEARDAWRQFRQAYAVARTYRPEMRETVIAEGADILDRLTALCGGEQGDSKSINTRFGQLVATVETELQAIS